MLYVCMWLDFSRWRMSVLREADVMVRWGCGCKQDFLSTNGCVMGKAQWSSTGQDGRNLIWWSNFFLSLCVQMEWKSTRAQLLDSLMTPMWITGKYIQLSSKSWLSNCISCPGQCYLYTIIKCINILNWVLFHLFIYYVFVILCAFVIFISYVYIYIYIFFFKMNIIFILYYIILWF